LPYERVLKKFDRGATFFFLDPPYWDRPKLYRFGFSRSDYALLADRLSVLKGKFLLTLNDVPDLRKLFKHYSIDPVEISYSAQRKSGRRYREIIIRNY
jgi:DNA adenine methylase